MSPETEKSIQNPYSIKEAKEILGEKNVFGPEEWKKFFGDKVNFTPEELAKIEKLPWSTAILKKPGIDQEHFLFLGLDRLDSTPLNLLTWHKVYSGENQPKFYLDWYLSHKFAQVSCELRWYLMPVGMVEGSNNLPYDRQVSMLPSEYEVPSAIERASANVLYYLLNRKYLDPDYWVHTDDESNGCNRVDVQGLSALGIRVYFCFEDMRSSIGVSASRKF